MIVWLAAKLAAEAMERLGQTAVLGELLAGVLIGPGVLGLVQESDALTILAELGVIVLLFEVGLESDLGGLLRAGPQSTVVALVGIACPFFLGYWLAEWWGMPSVTAVFIGATLTATSVGITARVLADIGRLQDAAAKVLLGAAVIDDILGLVILAVVMGLVQAGGFGAWTVGVILVKALAFVVLAIAVGIRFAPTLLAWVGLMRVRGGLVVVSMAFCALLAALAETIGLATIIGAFAAGLVLTKTERRVHIEEALKPVADLLVPVFFVTVGMKVEPGTFNPFGSQGWAGLALASLLTAVAVVTKLAAGLAVYQSGVRRWPVGVGMVPRGEVGLIFAGIGLAGGIIDANQYAAIVAMIMVSTFIVPPWLKAVY